MRRPLDHMFGMKDLRHYPVIAVQLVLATRLATLYARSGRDMLPGLAVRLRSLHAAQRVEALSETIDRLWPEPFLVSRPCRSSLSPDEMLLADVVMASARGDMRSAMNAMRDLLPRPARDELLSDIVMLVDAVRSAQDQTASDIE